MKFGSVIPVVRENRSEKTLNKMKKPSSVPSRDHFPDLHTSDGESTDFTDIDSDDESAVLARKDKYRNKVDEDVAVFLKLAEQMSIESLIFLLQGQTLAQQPNWVGPWHQKKVSNQIRPEANATLPPVKKVKKFRFAEVANNEVRVVVHEIKSINNYADKLWWDDEEMRSFRKDAIETVRFYSKHCQDYIRAVEDVFVSEDKKGFQKQLKKLSNEAYVRGFEAHIVSLLSDRRDLFCRAILALQDEVYDEGYDVSSKIIGEASERHSRLAADFAVQLARIDHVEALKVSLCR